jgi:hypothetical protein
LLSITVAGQGLSFTPCYSVIFAELHWTPGMLAQAEGKASLYSTKIVFIELDNNPMWISDI